MATRWIESNYGLGSWISKEQRRLTDAIKRAETLEDTQ